MSSVADFKLEWTRRSPAQMHDAYYLAYGIGTETGHPRAQGRFTALNWVLFGGPSPLDEVRLERPRTLDQVFAVLNILEAHRGGPTDLAAWTAGLNDMLLWLVGATPDPKFDLPRRHPDGTIPTVDELVEEMQAGNPYKTWGPEERRDARLEAQRMANRYRGAAEKADEYAARYGVRGDEPS